MATRNDLYIQFGPKLTEAIARELLKHINILRENQGMPQMTEQEFIDILSNHITELPDYDWMNES